MEPKFNHSVKVPTQYKKAAKLLKKSFEEGASVKGQIFEERHARKDRLYALIAKISKHKPQLDRLIEQSEILQNEPRLDKYICFVLITELLFGNGKLNGDSKPVQCIRNYKPKFDEILSELQKSDSQSTGDNNRNEKEILKPRYVRVNTNLLSRSDALEAFKTDGWQEVELGDSTEPVTYDNFLNAVRSLGDYDFVSDMHVKNLFVFPSSSKRFWARHPLVNESKLILQDKASCLPVLFLNPSKGSTVLDMCAAPGMKTSQLAAIMKNKGTIYAVEQHGQRYQTLLDLVKCTKSTSVHTIHQDALALTNDDVPHVEYILVDPSCSGSGMTEHLFLSNREFPAERLASLGGLQIKMLSHAMNAFYDAKKIVYSTCSIFPEENEHVVQRCLEICPNWELIKPLEFSETWKHFGSKKFKHIGKKCIYAKSDIDMTDGFFVAIFQRKDAENVDEHQIKEMDTNAVELEGNNDVHSDVKKKTKKKKKERQEDEFLNEEVKTKKKREY